MMLQIWGKYPGLFTFSADTTERNKLVFADLNRKILEILLEAFPNIHT